jgi:hypothetical protein
MLSDLSLEQQYCLCFIYLPNPPDKNINHIIRSLQFDKENFRRLLIKTELEPYTELLWKFGLKEVYIKHFNQFQKLNLNSKNTDFIKDLSMSFSDYLDHVIKYQPECVTYNEDGTKNIDTTSNTLRQEELELTELLIFLLEEKEKGICLNFKSATKNKNINTKNSFITTAITNKLIEEYDNRNLNEVNLSYDEAEWELLNVIDLQWIRSYIERFEGVVQTDIDNDIYYFEVYDAAINIHDIENYIDAEMIEKYAEEHYTKAEITLEFLKDRGVELKSKVKKKAGAKAKNDNIASISERMSYLIRLERFMNQNEYKDISKFPISNKDCRLIHDYLVFFNLMPDQRKKCNTTTTPENYIKALIKNYRLHRKYVAEQNMVHYLINSFKYNNVYPIK